MKKFIIAVLSISLSFILVVPSYADEAVSNGDLISFLSLLYDSQNCTLVAYNSSTPSATACDSSGAFMTQKVDYDVLRSLYNSVAIEGASIVQEAFVTGQFRWLSYGGYCWIQFLSDYAPNNGYCGNSLRKILYCDDPDAVASDPYLVANIVGSGYYLSNRPIGMAAASGYAGDVSVSQSAMDSALSVLNASTSNYVYCLGFVGGETRYYIKPTNNTTTQHLCNSSGQLMYYLKSAPEEEPTTPAFDDSAVITAINSVYGAITSLGSRIGTLINSVDTISQNLSVHIQNFVSAVTSLRADITGLRESLEYIFAEFTQLYPSDASMTLSPGDTLVWDSATMQEPVLSWEYVGDPYPPIYATGVSGFTGNVGYIDGYFALTPSTGNYFPSVLSVGNGSITMPYELVSSAVPNPAHVVPDGYTQYDSISSTGTQYIILPAVAGYSYNLSFCGGTGISNNLWGSVLDGCIYGSSNVYAGYPEYSANAWYFFNCNSFSTSERNDLSFDTRADTASLNGSSITSYGNPYTSFGGSAYALFGILNSSGNVDRFSTATIYAYSVVSPTGDLLINLIPCSNPSGEIGMYDTVTGTFLSNSGTGVFVAGAEVPTMISDEVRSYYNIVAVGRASSVGSYNQWAALDDGGTMHMLSAADCMLLDDAFTTVTYNSVDSFVPLEGSTLLMWEDDVPGNIIINYKSMSRFFTWFYRLITGFQLRFQTIFAMIYSDILPSAQDFITNTLLPLFQNMGTGCEHTYVTEVTREPTCTLPGIMSFTCSQCGESHSEIVDSLGHDWVCVANYVTRYTSGTNVVEQVGYDLYFCSRCREEYKDFAQTGISPDSGAQSIGDMFSQIMGKIGSFVGNIVYLVLGLADQMLTGFDNLVTSFATSAEQVLSFGGDYPLWLAGLWDIIPSDLQLALGFVVITSAVAIIGKKLLFS